MVKNHPRRLTAAIIIGCVLLLPQLALGETGSSSLDRHYWELAFGLGGAFPQFNTDDNIRTGLGLDCRLSYVPSRRGGFGLWIGITGSMHDSKKSFLTVDRPHLLADGDVHVSRYLALIGIGPEWSFGSPYTNHLRPRVTLGVGPAVFQTERMLQIVGFDKQEQLTLDKNTSIAYGVSASVGLEWDKPQDRHFWGIALDVIVSQVWNADVGFIEDGSGRDLTTLSIMLSIRGWRFGKCRC